MRPVEASRVRAAIALAVVVVVSGVAFGVMVWLYAHDHVVALDRRGFAVLGASRDGWLSQVASPASVIAPALLALAGLGALVILIRARAWVGVFAIVAGSLLAVRLAHAVKFAEHRPRPPGGLLHAGGYAFPSTDSALVIVVLAMAIAVAHVTRDPRTRVALVVAGGALTFVAGLLLVALRVHYPSDVLAGWALGVAVFAGCALVGVVVEAGWRLVDR